MGSTALRFNIRSANVSTGATYQVTVHTHSPPAPTYGSAHSVCISPVLVRSQPHRLPRPVHGLDPGPPCRSGAGGSAVTHAPALSDPMDRGSLANPRRLAGADSPAAAGSGAGRAVQRPAAAGTAAHPGLPGRGHAPAQHSGTGGSL